jgi:flagellin FlaB
VPETKEASMMKRLLSTLHRGNRDERGITGLETAIILIAFVVVATVFAFVVLTTGVFSSERGKESVFAGLNKARGTLELRGGVVISASGCPAACTVSGIQFAVANSAGGEPVSLATTGDNRTIMAYRDEAVIDNDVDYDITPIVGDTDALLEPGELFNVHIAEADITGATDLDPNSRFTLEIQAPLGAVLDVTRQLPAELSAVMQLH